MNIELRNTQVRQQDAWLSALALLVLPVGVIVALSTTTGPNSSALSSKLADLTIILLAEILVLAYCFTRYGRVELSELLPRGRDHIVLGLAILIQFWIFGMMAGPEGLRTALHDSIRSLPATQYWVAVVLIAVLGPLLEETFFRRYFLEILRHHYPTSVAALITMAVATALHSGQPLAGLAWIFFDQLFFTVVYLKSRLGASVIVHCFVNSLILFLSRGGS